jgi:DNA polymerase-3 subunit alpha
MKTTIQKLLKDKRYNKFVHLHAHDEYSIRDAMGRVEDIVDFAKEKGLPAICITNHGSIGGFIRQYFACKEAGIKSIFGCEVYINKHRKMDPQDIPEDGRKNNHLILIAKNLKGYKNIINITSDAWINGYYFRPRSDYQYIRERSEGIIVSTACMGGKLSRLLAEDDWSTAEKFIDFCKKCFKDFYVELIITDDKDQAKLNDKLCKIAKKKKVPTILTGDCHYLRKKDVRIHDTLVMIASKNTFSMLEDPEKKDKVFQYSVKDLYYKDLQEMYDLYKKRHRSNHFTEEVFISSVKNVTKIVNSIESFELDTSLKLPQVSKNSNGALKKAIKKGFKERGFSQKKHPEYWERMKYEYEIITEKGFSDYFLIVQEITSWTTKEGMLVGTGRGSAAGSLISYLLGITNIDPIKYGLLFERFISIERADIPDIDIDFEPCFRDTVKEHIIEVYGKDRTCTIGTYGTFKHKNALLDVARAHDVPLGETFKITKNVIGENKELDKMTFEELISEYPEFKAYAKKYPKVVKRAKGLLFQVNTMSKHAAGVIISSDSLKNKLALVMRDGHIFSAWQEGRAHKELSKIGFVKFDILGLQNLTVIRECLSLIKKRRKKDVDINNLPDNDKKSLQMANDGDTFGIFQFESNTAVKWLKEIGVDTFMDLSHITSIMRPGVSETEMAEEYVERKHGKDFTIPKVLRPILKETYGIIIYQEQIMLIAQEVGGFDKAESNHLRKTLGGKGITSDEKKKIIKEYKNKFLKGSAGSLKKSKAEKLWNEMESFAKYGFNKSHAVSYSYIGYIELYLKSHYFIEFMCSLVNNTSRGKEDKNKEKTIKVYIKYIRSKGYEVTGPNINKSEEGFSIIGKKSIAFGFSHIKGIGISSKAVVENRPYKGLKDFCEKTKGKKVTKTKVEALIYSGAFDKFGERNELIHEYNTEINKSKKYERDDLSHVDLIHKEVEMINVAVSGSIFPQKLTEIIKKKKWMTPEKANRRNKEKVSKLFGILTGKYENKTRKGNKYYTIIISDDFDSIALNLFDKKDMDYIDKKLEINDAILMKDLEKHVPSGKWNMEEYAEDSIRKQNKLMR